jgi:B12-binding domain/radical SAM domain protein
LPKKIAFIIYYQKQNIYSFNALVAALETQKDLEDIKIYFARGKENLFDKLKSILQKFDLIILGISFFTSQLWEIHDLIQKINKKYTKKVIKVAGGPHATGEPFNTLKMGFDLVVVGEGEETIIEIMKKAKNEEYLTNIKGTGYLDQEKQYLFTGKRKPIDLNDYPPLPIKHLKFGAIEITRGCPYVCYFCQTPYILGTFPRHRNIDSICQAIEFMANRYNKKDIRFISPNAFSYGSLDGKTLNLVKLTELVKRVKSIIEPDGRLFLGSFPSEVRPEHVMKETLELVKNYASNDNIVIGAQSGSQRILDLCNRGHTIDDIFNAVQLTLEFDIKAIVDFIFGFPFQEDEDIDLTIAVIKELTTMGARIHTHSFLPLPQTVFKSMDVKKITKKVRKTLHELNVRGLAFGEWEKQENLAFKIARMMKQKKKY